MENKIKDIVEFHINNGGITFKSKAQRTKYDYVEQTLEISAHHFDHQTNKMCIKGKPEEMMLLGQYLIDIAKEGIELITDSDEESHVALSVRRRVQGNGDYIIYPNGRVRKRDDDSVMYHSGEVVGTLGEDITIEEIKSTNIL